MRRRIFFVDTASSTAVDLGCEYLAVDGAATACRVITSSCRSRRLALALFVPAGGEYQADAGPGGATSATTWALRRWPDSLRTPAGRSERALVATDRDTLTLWHLLSRVDAPRAVFDRLAVVPATAAEQVGDPGRRPAALERWRDDLENSWFADWARVRRCRPPQHPCGCVDASTTRAR
jgi:hypothetical protein